MNFEALIASPIRVKKTGKKVPQISAVNIGLPELNIGGNSFCFEESETSFKNNTVTFRKKMGKAIVTLTIKNPEQFSQ